MSLRVQILLGAIVMAVLPLALAIKVIGTVVEGRVTDLDTERVADQLALARGDLARQSREVAVLLDALAETIQADNRFRLAVSGTRPDLAAYQQSFAPRQMSLMNLDMLQIQDEEGRVVSSGHFPYAHGRMDPRLPVLLARAPGGQALIGARTPEQSFLALGRARSVSLGGRIFQLVGGKLMDDERLRSLDRDGDLALAVVWPDGFAATGADLTRRLAQGQDVLEVEYRLRRDGVIVQSEHLPLVWEGELDSARLLVTHDRAGLQRLLRELNRWLLAVAGVAAALAVIMAALFSARVTRPLRDLAARTENLDWGRLDVEFRSDRRDEVGRLTRLLSEMTGRLRDGVKRLRRAEQQATMGEMARQVNHDIRNGITPLRNVLRHLSEVGEREPGQLPTVFADRRGTLEDGLTYLEELATHYARLSPGRAVEPCRFAEIAAAVLADTSTGQRARLVNTVPTNLPAIHADPISLRRILDNLVRNALEALPDGEGTVTVDATVDAAPRGEESRILVSVSDNGEGIAAEHLDTVFTDFFTTRDGGTGLGLSNVRRLMADCGGTVRVASERGRGTTFTLSFPLSDGAEP